MKTGDVKNVTIATDPADATDSQTVIDATTATSADDTIATVAKNDAGGFDITAVKAGTVKITFTSGSFTVTVDVTITDPDAG